jgi:hypothetical protein
MYRNEGLKRERKEKEEKKKLKLKASIEASFRLLNPKLKNV